MRERRFRDTGVWKPEEKENNMRLIKLDSQLDEAKFKLFLEKYIDKIVNVVKTTRSRKALRYICD